MIIDRNPCSNRYDVSCEIDGGPLRRLGWGACNETFASQVAATLTATAASTEGGYRRSARVIRRRRWATAPGLAFAALMAAATTAIASRAAIVSIAPATAIVYAHLGMPVNLRGLSIDRIRATAGEETEDGRELLVTGEIVNLRESETPVPDLRLALRAEDGRELYVWTARGPKKRLGPHERFVFRARLAAPPPGVRDVLVKFGAPGDKASFTESHS